jgi:hypothetical protein
MAARTPSQWVKLGVIASLISATAVLSGYSCLAVRETEHRLTAVEIRQEGAAKTCEKLDRILEDVSEIKIELARLRERLDARLARGCDPGEPQDSSSGP